MEALQDIWTDLGARVRAFVGKRINDSHAVEDITQDVMLKTHARLADPSGHDNLAAWVFGVARNAVVDHYRARGRQPQSDLDETTTMTVTVEDAGDERNCITAELATCLRRMVSHLPEPYREALTLADLDGRTQQEVADRTGLSLSGAKSRVQRARRQLHEMILDCCRVELDRRGGIVGYQPTERTGKYCGDGPDTCAKHD